MAHGFVAGIDLGATNVRVVIANQDGEVEARRAGPLPDGDPLRVLDRIGRIVDDLIRGVWVGAKVAAIGVAVPGSVDSAGGMARSIANMPGWDDVAVAASLGGARGVPCAVENDANAAAIGEGWLGAAKGLRDYVFLALGTGIGGGVVLDGRLHHGAHNLAGEVAFFPMTREHLLAPGWTSCLEGEVGGRAADAAAVRLLGERARAAALFEAARAGDAKAVEWLSRVQEYLAMAVAQVCSLLDPEAVIFGGGVVAAQGEALIARVRELALGCLPARPQVLLSSLGEDAQIMGAVRLALDAVARGVAT